MTNDQGDKDLSAGPLGQPYYTSHPTPATSSAFVGNQPYYSYSAWQNNWPHAGLYTSSNQIPQSHPQNIASYQPQNLVRAQSHYAPGPEVKPRSPSLSPSPPPETYQHWDAIIISFLRRLGLTQAVAGFEADMLVLNADWERKQVPDALAELVKRASILSKAKDATLASPIVERSLEDRKLDYVHLANNAQPRSPSTINKLISEFLAQNRARNDKSNRAEFLHTLAEKRQLLGDLTVEQSSCARVDAKPIDRDVQMKYDIAKNDEGPLSRTIFQTAQEKGKQKQKVESLDVDVDITKTGRDRTVTPESHPGLDERLRNIETHLAVRYVPSPPRALLDRLKLLEEHLIRLEKEYPSWAALHFNQLNRGWPPPPRLTPVIVPTHMRPPSKEVPVASDGPGPMQDIQSGASKSKTSSLHRAVLERLEVQKAMNDLASSSER